MKSKKKGGISGFIIMIVFLVLGLLAFVLFMPIGLPFIDMVAQSDANPLTKFLFLGIPIFTLVAIIVGLILK